MQRKQVAVPIGNFTSTDEPIIDDAMRNQVRDILGDLFSDADIQVVTLRARNFYGPAFSLFKGDESILTAKTPGLANLWSIGKRDAYQAAWKAFIDQLQIRVASIRYKASRVLES